MMKKLAVALAIASISTAASVALAGPGAGTGVNGSMHDINSVVGYTGDSLGRSCVFCHTPHNARTTDALVPLWNHAASTVPIMAPYAWVAPTNKAIAFAGDPLVGPSRLCMACHDGTTAVDSHGSAASGDGTGHTAMASSYTDALGATAKRYIKDLTVTHPIGFQYDQAQALRTSTEIVPSTSGFISGAIDPVSWDTHNRGAQGDAANGGVITAGTSTSAKKIKDTLYGGYMTCATCHDVHNSVNAKPARGHSYNYFLYAQEEGSAICLSCHVK
jgi:hypothetical protein